MEGLIVHRGGEIVTKEQLDLIKTPDDLSQTYGLVRHYDLADRMSNVSQDILRDYTLVSEQYAIARQGNQLFAYLRFQTDNPEMGLSICYRNSMDSSLSIGVVVGANCWICDNLAIEGDIAIMRKHTKNIWNDLEDLIISTLYKAGKRYQRIVEDTQVLKRQRLNDDDAFALMGIMYGRGIVSPRQVTVLKDEWLRPSHQEFERKDMFAFYMATTEALKSSPPSAIMENHSRAYKMLVKGMI